MRVVRYGTQWADDRVKDVPARCALLGGHRSAGCGCRPGLLRSVFNWEFDVAGGAAMIRRPGYGDHLAATIDPDILERHATPGTPPGFSDAIGWTGQLSDEQQPEHWQVAFAVANRDESA